MSDPVNTAATVVDTTAKLVNGDVSNILVFISAAAGLGTAAMGLVDSTKAFMGGPSNFGFGYIVAALKPYLLQGPKGGLNPAQMFGSLKAGWLNGVPKADQKAKAKALVHLCLTPDNAKALATQTGVDAVTLEDLAKNVASGNTVTGQQVLVLGQFDALLSTVLDAAYERADQKYRNASKLLAMATATVLGVVGGWLVYASGQHSVADYFGSWQFGLSFLIGLSATPLAPMAKDLSTSLQAAATAVRVVKR